jgi:hypothetical protein
VVEQVLRTSEEDIKLFVGLARKLWFWRNEVIHGGQFIHPNELVKRTICSIDDYEAATKKDVVASAAVGDIFKINWDAGLNHKEGRIGVIPRNLYSKINVILISRIRNICN